MRVSTPPSASADAEGAEAPVLAPAWWELVSASLLLMLAHEGGSELGLHWARVVVGMAGEKHRPADNWIYRLGSFSTEEQQQERSRSLIKDE